MYAILARKCVAQSVKRDDSPRSGKVTLFFALRVSSNHFFFLFRFLLRIYIYMCIYLVQIFFFLVLLALCCRRCVNKRDRKWVTWENNIVIKLNFLSSSYETRWFRKYFLLFFFFFFFLPFFSFLSVWSLIRRFAVKRRVYLDFMGSWGELSWGEIYFIAFFLSLVLFERVDYERANLYALSKLKYSDFGGFATVWMKRTADNKNKSVP